MAVTSAQITVPSTGTVTVFQSTPSNSNALSIRNTGSTTVFLGTSTSQVFPLNAGEFIGLEVANDDKLTASGGGSAGTLVVLGVG